MYAVGAQLTARQRIQHLVLNDDELSVTGSQATAHLLDVLGPLGTEPHTVVVGARLQDKDFNSQM